MSEGKTFDISLEGKQLTLVTIGDKHLELQGSNVVKFQPHSEENTGFITAVGGDFVITSGLTDKSIKFWKIKDIATSEGEPKVYHEWKHAKKLTALHWIDFALGGKDFSGIIFSDKFGEVRFYNIVNLPQGTEEEMKANGEENEERENNVNLWYAHQDIVTHLEVAHDQKYIFTVDKSKIKITHFPEILSVHSVVFHALKEVTNFIVINSTHFLAFSSRNKQLKIWKINEDSSDLVKEFSGDSFHQLIGEALVNDDKVSINKVSEDGTIIMTLSQASITKAIVAKVDLE
mmetsp:Transcript_21803/g.19334  ORF Transcript_21803/g.19334 Transcript_21803/m.19334 type:complete len:289 (+) Transcript_21803:31-897(+)